MSILRVQPGGMFIPEGCCQCTCPGVWDSSKADKVPLPGNPSGPTNTAGVCQPSLSGGKEGGTLRCWFPPSLEGLPGAAPAPSLRPTGGDAQSWTRCRTFPGEGFGDRRGVLHPQNRPPLPRSPEGRRGEGVVSLTGFASVRLRRLRCGAMRGGDRAPPRPPRCRPPPVGAAAPAAGGPGTGGLRLAGTGRGGGGAGEHATGGDTRVWGRIGPGGSPSRGGIRARRLPEQGGGDPGGVGKAFLCSN